MPNPPEPATDRRIVLREFYVVACLSVILLLGFMDRYTLSLVANPIIADLGITKVQMSLLVGLSFVVLYSLLSIPAGYLADRVDRRMMLCIAVILWSCMSLLCGLAGNYWQLFAGRVGLGVGEAALPPTAYSLIRDTVHPKRRSRAFGVYQLGGLVGTGLGALVGGTLYGLASNGSLAGIPLIGSLKPWQVVLAVPGLCGIPISLLLLTLREPARIAPGTGAVAPTFGAMFRYTRQHWRIYLPIVGSAIIGGMGLSGWNNWLPSVINLTWGLPIAEVGKISGLITVIASPISALAISSLMDYVTRGRSPAGAVWVSLIGGAISLGFSLAILLAPGVTLMWLCFALANLITGGFITAPATVIAYVTPSALTGKVTSFYYLISNLLGFAVGPTVYALVAEHVFHGEAAMTHAMLLCYAVLGLGSSLCVFALARELGRWKARAESE